MQSILLAMHDRHQAAVWHAALSATGVWNLHTPVHSFAEVRRSMVLRSTALLVTDLCLRDGTVVDMVRVLRPPDGEARARVLVLCAHESEPLLLDALQAGADNFFVTGVGQPDAPANALATRVRDTLAGDTDIAPWIARRLLDHFGSGLGHGLQRNAMHRHAVEDLNNPLALTAGERLLLRQLAVGARLADVAHHEGVRPPEIFARLRGIYRKMQWGLRAGDLQLN